MNIKELFLDASKYATSNWTRYILLGITFVFIDLFDDLTESVDIPLSILIFLLSLFVILVFIQAGYIFRIIETSVDGSNKLPPFNHIKQLFFHGIKDSAVAMAYIFIPIILFLILLGPIMFYLGANNSLDLTPIVIMIFIAILVVCFIFLQAAIINMACHQGKIKAAFEFKGIIGQIKNVGLKKFLIVCFLAALIILILEPFIRDNVRSSLDLPSGTLIEIVLVPYLSILTSRFLGRMGRKEIN
jgi:hypothetical protein